MPRFRCNSKHDAVAPLSELDVTEHTEQYDVTRFTQYAEAMRGRSDNVHVITEVLRSCKGVKKPGRKSRDQQESDIARFEEMAKALNQCEEDLRDLTASLKEQTASQDRQLFCLSCLSVTQPTRNLCMWC